jgi:lipoyl(octanoyl) transferase
MLRADSRRVFRAILCREYSLGRTRGCRYRLSTTSISVAPVSPPDSSYRYPTITRIHSALSQGCIDYARGWAWQHFLLSRRLARRRQDESAPQRDPDTVLLFEHESVYTLGRGADENHLTFLQQEEEHSGAKEKLSRSNRGVGSARLSIDRRLLENDLLHRSDEEAINILCSSASPVIAPNGAPVYRVDRGGEVTYHGPGQLIVYPSLDLQRRPYQPDLHWFLRMVEEAVIQTLRHYDIEGCRDETNTGVWVGEKKVCAVGVAASRWITTHGFALNVCPDLSYFDTSVILPCGIDGRGVTSISQVLCDRGDGKIPSMDQVAAIVLQNLQDVFQIEMEPGETLW